MPRSRGRQHKNSSKSKAGLILALLLIVLLVAGLVFAVSQKDRILGISETIALEPKENENPASEESEFMGDTQGETRKGMETLPVVETETAPQYRDEITLTFAGDVLFDPNYAIMATLIQRGGDISTCFDDNLMEIMKDSDIFMINNEFPYSDRGEPLEEKQFTFRAKPEYASKLNDMGVDIVSLGNNHVNDHGTVAMMDTFDTLDAVGIPYVGAGRNLEEASEPVYFEIEGVKIAIVCATQIERLPNPDTVAATETTPGVLRCLSTERFCNVISEAKQNADFVVAYIHWGTESEDKIDWLQQEQAPVYVKAGADLIIGDHPHVLQKMEIIDGVPVLYSMGNYLFNSGTLDTGLAKVTVDTKEKKISSLQFIPAKQSGCRTTMLEGTEKTRVIEHINTLSDKDILDADGYMVK